MTEHEFSYEDARRWLAKNPTENVSMGELKRRALSLGSSALPAMIEVLARGSAEEVRGAFSVLYMNGVRVKRIGDAPERCSYLLTFRDGTTRSVHPENLEPEDFDDES